MTELEQAVRAARRPVALTGAGISAPSGIPTFQGTWKNQPIRNFLSRSYFQRHPLEFFELFCEMVSWCDCSPNAAHLALAHMNIPVITQNIDTLHEKAGTRQLYTLHGTLFTVHCPHCPHAEPAADFAARLRPLYAARKTSASSDSDLSAAIRCPRCGAVMDTDVVLYGDNVRFLDEAIHLAETCDLMLVVGTSLTTYPAAALPDMARRQGARILTVNSDCISAFSEN